MSFFDKITSNTSIFAHPTTASKTQTVGRRVSWKNSTKLPQPNVFLETDDRRGALEFMVITPRCTKPERRPSRQKRQSFRMELFHKRLPRLSCIWLWLHRTWYGCNLPEPQGAVTAAFLGRRREKIWTSARKNRFVRENFGHVTESWSVPFTEWDRSIK